jgi:hypothetical protein
MCIPDADSDQSHGDSVKYADGLDGAANGIIDSVVEAQVRQDEPPGEK